MSIRRVVIVVAAALAALATLLPWGWSGGAGQGDGKILLLLAAGGAGLALHGGASQSPLFRPLEALLGALAACTGFAHLAWGEHGLGLALLAIAGPAWSLAAALPGFWLGWLAEAESEEQERARSRSTRRCPDCFERLRPTARICRFCGQRLEHEPEPAQAGKLALSVGGETPRVRTAPSAREPIISSSCRSRSRSPARRGADRSPKR